MQCSYYIVGFLAVLVYANTLIGDFTFDDNFAVITNGDVTNDGNPISGLFKHDFWGQDITSTQSHKSYRPITILAFRWTRQAWDIVQLLTPGINQKLPVPPPLPQQLQAQQQDAFGGKAPRPAGLHPFPFHVLSIALHAVASMLVLALSQHLFAKLEQATGSTSNNPSSTDSTGSRIAATTAKAYTSSSSGSSLLARWVMWDCQPGLFLVPVNWKGRQLAIIAGLLFALHPAHTEAVAGVVGCAELICAVWSIPGLLLYFMAVDGRYAAATQLQQHVSTDSSSGRQSSSSKQVAGGSKARQQQLSRSSAAVSNSDSTSSALLFHLHVADAVQHWLLVLSAAVLAVLAALSKEIGITVTGTMVLYDLLLAPHMLPEAPLGKCSSTSSSKDSSKQQNKLQVRICRRQVLRVVLLAVVTLLYVKLRSWVAVKQLVDIYRKVENPIPFARSRLTRLMSTGYLHSRYFGLLLLPLHLSADWSFSCIPLVEQLSDTRNLATAALYLYFLYAGLSAGPCQLLQRLWGVACSVVPVKAAAAVDAPLQDEAAVGPCKGSSKKGGGDTNRSSSGTTHQAAAASRLGHARWRLMVLAGLLIGPYFPASNVLFYVGTFIGERLLYFPSIGYCLLLADLLGALLPTQQQQQDGVQQHDKQGTSLQSRTMQNSTATESATTAAAAAADGGSCRDRQQRQTANSKARHALLLTAVLVLLLGYFGRTVLRNADWWDEERLFLAAERVCPNSAKVQQNCGVLQRRYQNFKGAMQHFRRAQEIEPGYCEPSYWIALTTINMGDLVSGLAAMKASLSCKYTAAEALQTLNKLYVMMHDNTRTDPMPLVDWAGVLASPNVLRVGDACATTEDAALLATSIGKSYNFIEQALDVCLQGIREWEEGDEQPDTLAALARTKYASLNATLLRECVKMRRVVYKKLASNSPKSKTVRQALYKYMAKVQQKYPDCRSLAGGGNVPMDDQSSAVVPSSHQKLVHRVQSADPEDPWLQLEWGQTLIALGGEAALKDAAMHLEVASAIFMRTHQHLQDGSSSGGGSTTSDKTKLAGGLTALDGKTQLTAETALEAAMQPLERFKTAAVNSSQPLIQAAYCEMLKRLCHLRLLMVVQVQQQSSATAAAAQEGSGVTAGLRKPSSMKAVLNAKAAARRCLAEITDRRGCEQQADEIRRLVGRGSD